MYNIQNELHTQGYFGVKVTPLGSNLAIFEGHEEGEACYDERSQRMVETMVLGDSTMEYKEAKNAVFL
jgi:hypothetical protein